MEPLAFFSNSWIQIIEIIAVAVLFYYLLNIARSTKGQVVIGIIIAVDTLYVICQFFQLITLKFILDFVLKFGPLAVLIIFAPEIRKVLEQASKTNRLIEWFLPREEEQHQQTVHEAVVESAHELAGKLVGGLIIIERKDSVDEHLVPGMEIQALPNPRLLVSIFEKHNPLHDGAVLIREDRIWSAGNFLPISESTFLGDDLGTRHRAAVGLSERCDAVVIVVSEERGELSVAFHGRLARGLTNEQFIEQLRAVTEPNENFASLVPRTAFI